MSDICVNTVWKTNDYDKFKLLVSSDKSTHEDVSDVLISTLRYGQIPVPIIVNQNFEIIDGVIRFYAWKQLGWPIFYMIINDVGRAECAVLNTTRNDRDNKYYLELFADDNDDGYYMFFRDVVNDGLFPEENIEWK